MFSIEQKLFSPQIQGLLSQDLFSVFVNLVMHSLIQPIFTALRSIIHKDALFCISSE